MRMQQMPDFTFATDGLPPGQAFDAWQAQFGALNEIAVPPEARPRFAARCEAWRLGAMLLTSNRTPAMRMARLPRHAARDGLDHWVLRVARSGRVRTRLGEAALHSAPGQPVLYNLADGYVGEWEAAEWVSLSIPRDAFPGLTSGLSRLPPGIQVGGPAGLLADLLLAMPGRLAEARPEDRPALTEAMRGMVAACLLATLPPAAAEAQGPGGTGLLLLRERVRRVVQQNLGSSRLTPGRIAQAVGVARSTLYRAFEADGGVARQVQRMRLAMVHDALCDPAQARRTIAALALAHGFHDPSAFSRVFRATYGHPPGEVRAAALAGTPVPPLIEAGGAGLVGMLAGAGAPDRI